MTTNPIDIESELSFAYLKAIAARAGCDCTQTTRLSDNKGIDAIVSFSGDFGPNQFSQVTIHFQLKSTYTTLDTTKTHIKYDLREKAYNDSREYTENARYVLLLILPNDEKKWLTSTKSLLTLRTCAYWFSNYKAPALDGTKGKRVLIPKRNRFTVQALKKLLQKSAKEERVPHVATV